MKPEQDRAGPADAVASRQSRVRRFIAIYAASVIVAIVAVTGLRELIRLALS